MAGNSVSGNVKVRDISRRQEVSVKYLEQVIAALSKEGFVTGERGPQGGYRLRIDPAEVTAGDVVRAMDGPSCTEGDAKPYSEIWSRIGTAVDAVLDDYTIADLAEKEAEIRTSKGPEYLI